MRDELLTAAALNVEYAAPEPEKPIGFVRSLVPPVPKDE